MKKSLFSIMAAAGLIVSGNALADSSLVEIYGTLNIDFENVKATGGSAAQALPAGQMGTAPNGVVQPSRNRVTSNSSNIGFRGSENLWEGLKGVFQVESQLNLDGSNSIAVSGFNGGKSATPIGTFSSRNSNVGLSSSKLGTIFYGIWDTPYKSLTNTLTFSPFFSTGIADVNTMIGTPGFNVATATEAGRVNGANSTVGVFNTTTGAITVTGSGAAADASFDRRQGNAVQYWTPNWAGLSARFAYSANEQRTNEPPGAGTTNVNPTIFSASLRYEYGPFLAAYAFEQHRDYFGLTALQPATLLTASPSNTNKTSRDNGNKVTLSYTLWSNTVANVAWERLAYNNSDTNLGDLIHYHRDLIYFAAQHHMGPHTFRLGFGSAWAGGCDRAGGTACSTTGLDAKHYALGYSYSFSKRTDMYAFWTRVNNGQFATYQLGNGAGLSASAGNHSQGLLLGFRHVF